LACRPVAATISLVAALVVQGPAPSSPSHAAPSRVGPLAAAALSRDETAIRIMPLGDSLTVGHTNPCAYRLELRDRLVADGLQVDFVGSQANGPPTLADQEHEGHSGWRIDQLSGSVVTWLDAHNPQVVLLMIGTNDMVQNFEVAAAPDRLSALVDQITSTLPTAHVIVATIPRAGDPARLERVMAYNAAIPDLVGAKGANGERVSYVDVFAVVDDGDLHPDLVHLNAGGNSKIAEAWYSAIRAALGLDSPHPPPEAASWRRLKS
jgi:lysophospholipase L1-like esterase